jgi:hypothetical protein
MTILPRNQRKLGSLFVFVFFLIRVLIDVFTNVGFITGRRIYERFQNDGERPNRRLKSYPVLSPTSLDRNQGRVYQTRSFRVEERGKVHKALRSVLRIPIMRALVSFSCSSLWGNKLNQPTLDSTILFSAQATRT